MQIVKTIDAENLGADPATPVNVRAEDLFFVPRTVHSTTVPVNGIMLRAVGAIITVQLYVVLDDFSAQGSSLVPDSNSRFAALGELTVVPQDKFVSVAEAIGSGAEFPLIPPAGHVYVRVTAGNAPTRSVEVALV